MFFLHKCNLPILLQILKKIVSNIFKTRMQRKEQQGYIYFVLETLTLDLSVTKLITDFKADFTFREHINSIK